MRSNCTDGKLTMSCSVDEKLCNGLPIYKVNFGYITFPVCQKNDGKCSFDKK